jgi:23S rRNA (uracil1939-C5)-methyltransferase
MAARGREPEIAEAGVHALDQDGRGVARIDGKVTFIDGALPGERVRVAIGRRRRRFDEARTLEVLTASPERVAARCPHFGLCGGCSLQHLDPEAQLAHKQADVLDKLERIGGVVPAAVHAPVRGPVWGYRRKARLGCKYVPGKGGVLVGFRERRAHLIADIGECHVLAPAVGGRIRALRELLGTLDAREAIPQIEVAAGDAATVLVLRHLAPLSAADRERLRRFAREQAIAVALQPGGPDSVVALEPAPLPRLHYRLAEFDLELAFEPLDFVQVNAPVNEALVSRAVAALGAPPGAPVLDLFCGLGNFSLALARRGASVTGVELGEAMVQRAGHNAAGNGVHGARFHAGDLSDPAVAARWVGSGARYLLLDPPRSGAEAVVAALAAGPVRRVVYISCNPATLARDAGELVKSHGFDLESVALVDMFPHTNHVESLAVFGRGA